MEVKGLNLSRCNTEDEPKYLQFKSEGVSFHV